MICAYCGGEMKQWSRKFRCGRCGYHNSCCDGGKQVSDNYKIIKPFVKGSQMPYKTKDIKSNG